MFDFNIFSKQVGDLRGQVDKLTTEISQKEAELKRLRTAPPPKSDVLDALRVIFSARAESAKRVIYRSFEQWQEKPLQLSDAAFVVPRMHVLNAVEPNMAPTTFTLECALLAVLGPAIEQGARKLLDEMDWPTPGPSINDRPKLIAKAETELERLTDTLADIRRQASDAGILI